MTTPKPSKKIDSGTGLAPESPPKTKSNPIELAKFIKEHPEDSAEKAQKEIELNDHIQDMAELMKSTWNTVDEEEPFENWLPDDHFISRYLIINKSRVDTYPEFNFLTDFFLLGVMSQRKLWIYIGAERTYPNFYLMYLGESGIAGKSSAQKRGLYFFDKVVGQDVRHLRYKKDVSKERQAEILERNAQGVYWYDEYALFLARSKRGYMSGMKEFHVEMYDCPDVVYALGRVRRNNRDEDEDGGRGDVTITDSFPHILTGCQKSVFTEKTEPYDVGQGWLARFLCVMPTRVKTEFLRYKRPTEEEIRDETEITTWLQEIWDFFKGTVGYAGVEVRLTDTALNLWNDWRIEWLKKLQQPMYQDEEGFNSCFVRIAHSVLKIAMVFMMGDPRFRTLIQERKKWLAKYQNLAQITPETIPFEDAEGDIQQVEIPLLYNQEPEDQEEAMYWKGGDYNIPLSYLKLAIRYAEEFFIPHTRRMIQAIEYDKKADLFTRVYETILRNQPISRQELIAHKKIKGTTAKELDEVIDTQRAGGLIQKQIVRKKTKGPLTTMYATIAFEYQEEMAASTEELHIEELQRKQRQYSF